MVLRAEELEIEPVKSIDPLRPIAHVRANAVEVGADAALCNLSMATAHALMTTLLSAEAIGVARWATDTASQYAKIREQFGRPIGQFQAIKHNCAEIADTERVTAAVWDAARAIDEARENGWDITGPHVEFAAAVAATLAPAAARRRAQDCIQVHGGIGLPRAAAHSRSRPLPATGQLLRSRVRRRHPAPGRGGRRPDHREPHLHPADDD